MAVEIDHEVVIPIGEVALEGELQIPPGALGLVLFAHGSGSSRLSPRNQMVARTLREGGFGTLLFNLLTREEEVIDSFTRHLRFDVVFLADRLMGVTEWIKAADAVHGLKIGYCGSSTGAAAALVAAARLGSAVGAVVSRGGRPDLASPWLSRVVSPTLLLVGELDLQVLDLNQTAQSEMKNAITELHLVPDATHLFEEPGVLERAAAEASAWFQRYLVG